MKTVVLIVSVLAMVTTAFGAVTDKTPFPASTPPLTPSPAFGDLIRSFSLGSGPTYPGGVAGMYDGYVITGHWGTSFTAWYVYTTTGSFVRSVPISGMSVGFRGGSGANHLGTGYFAGAFLSSGIRAYTYTAGGTPGTTYTQVLTAPTGRGVAYDGTYYYATNGSYGAPIGRYTTAGSMVNTIALPSTLQSNMYDYATPAPGNGYIYVTNQSPNSIVECNITSGAQTRSISVPATFPAGCDIRMADGYLYTTIQLSAGLVNVYDCGVVGSGVAPASLGTIKSLYR